MFTLSIIRMRMITTYILKLQKLCLAFSICMNFLFIRVYADFLSIEDILTINNFFYQIMTIDVLNINTYSNNNILIFHFIVDCVIR